MSLRKHRRNAEGKRTRSRRMPKPDQIRLGTRVHQSKRLNENDDSVECVRCAKCGRWGEGDDYKTIERRTYLCPECTESEEQ
jgi:hypothetical protein